MKENPRYWLSKTYLNWYGREDTKNEVRGNLSGASSFLLTGFIHDGSPKISTFN